MLSIIVTNYRAPDLLKLCLKSIKDAGAGLIYEIIVVNSSADEESEEMLAAEFPEIKKKSFSKNVGYAKMVNAGLKRAGGDYLLILNADMVLTKDSLKKMVERMEKDSSIGILGPQLLNFDGSIQESCYRFYRPITIIYRRTFFGKTKRGQRELNRFLMSDFNKKEEREVDWLLGAALMVSSRALAKVGRMDERFFLYFEDVDWCRRFQISGFKVIYFPDAKMHHYHGRGSKKNGGLTDLFLTRYAWIHLSSAIKYFWKWR